MQTPFDNIIQRTARMKALILFLLTVNLTFLCRAADSIEPSWFPRIDGVGVKGEYIDLNTNGTERLYIRYSPAADQGVELERTTNNLVIWRAHVRPLGIVNSKYCHEVSVRVREDNIYVTSIGGVDLSVEDGRVVARNNAAKEISEIRSLKTGALVSRNVSDLPPRP